MRNKFPGICYYCGKMVDKGMGHFEKIRGTSSWRVIHVECVFKQREEKANGKLPKR